MPNNKFIMIMRRFRQSRLVNLLSRIFLFIISITAFIFSLVLMKEGAKPLEPMIRGTLSVDSPASALGFGWLGSSLALSGSPVAATALSLLDAQVLSPQESFAMVAGSRLGAAFVVLLVGFIYVIRGKQRDVSLSVGLLSLLVTQTIYPAVLALGFLLLSTKWLHRVQVSASQEMNSPFEIIFGPFITQLQQIFPTWIFFPVGFLIIMGSLWLFDRVIPDINLQETELGLVHHLLYRPVVTFALGAGITAITMSVSVSLSLLVPLSVRGMVRRENVIPYILGANITTFVDTLVAAALLSNPVAISVVLVQMASVMIVSLILLLTSFRFYERTLQKVVIFLGRRRRRIVAYIFLILGIPFLLLWLG